MTDIKRLNELLKKYKIRQLYLAQQSGYSCNYLSKILNGHTPMTRRVGIVLRVAIEKKCNEHDERLKALSEIKTWVNELNFIFPNI